jgi:hypothetical protein
METMKHEYAGFEVLMAVTTESSVWIVTLRSSETAHVSDKYIALVRLSLLPASAAFLFALLIKLEDGGNTFLKNVRLSPNDMVLQPKRPQSSSLNGLHNSIISKNNNFSTSQKPHITVRTAKLCRITIFS